MKHEYISLGAACNAATIMKNLRIRNASYPFDWLLNHEDGLSVVSDIINSNFSNVSSDLCYKEVYYPPIGRCATSYVAYPRTFHIHSNPISDKKAHGDMVRRFERLQKVLSSTVYIHFVYYRNLSVCRSFGICQNASDAFERMVEEGAFFLESISHLRKGKTSLLMVLEADDEDIVEAKLALDNTCVPDQKIELCLALSRYDENEYLHARWKSEWADLIFNHTLMPWTLRLRCRIRSGLHAIRAHQRSWKMYLALKGR